MHLLSNGKQCKFRLKSTCRSVISPISLPLVRRHPHNRVNTTISRVSKSNGEAQNRRHAKDEEEDEDEDEEDDSFLDEALPAVVKVFCIHTEPNFALPWQRKRQNSSSSSGFVCTHKGKRYLLTNAHSVEYHTQVKVKRRGDDRKFLAKVLAIGIDCDVACLEVEDQSFWEPFGTAAIEFGDLPRLQDSVAVVGYPVGGDTVSITAGVVSRIEVCDYSLSSTDLLAIQIDAAINAGNSGGPVFSSETGECIGIAFQALVGEDIENCGYVIPSSVVLHFLNDLATTGTFNGFPALGVQWQKMESEALRKTFRMNADQKGVLCRKINPTSPTFSFLKPDDVLLRFASVEISNDGTVPFRTGERISFSHLISQRYIGDKVDVEVLRDGVVMKFSLPLSKPTKLIPPHTSNSNPKYFIAAGLVFTVANEPYLREEYGNEWSTLAPVKILDRIHFAFPQTSDEELVILSQVLACDATIGYEDVCNTVVVGVNGHRVRNLKQLAEVVLSCADPYLAFELDHSEMVVIRTADLRLSTYEVMENHSIPDPMSADLSKDLAFRLDLPPVT